MKTRLLLRLAAAGVSLPLAPFFASADDRSAPGARENTPKDVADMDLTELVNVRVSESQPDAGATFYFSLPDRSHATP